MHGPTCIVWVNLTPFSLQYTFSVVVTTFLNASSAPAFGHVYKSRDDIPLVQIEGPAVLHTMRPDTLELHSTIEPSSCFPAVDASFKWEQMDSHDLVELGRTNTPTLVLPPDTLMAGLTYQFTMVGLMLENANLIHNDTVSIVVDYVGVQVIIAGGYRAVSRVDDCVLDARSSIDMDGIPEPFVFQWSCIMSTGQACDGGVGGYLQTS
jgi:hypothetical protein